MNRILVGTLIALGIIGTVIAANAADLDKLDKQVFSPAVQISDNCSGTMIYSDRDKTTGEVSSVVLTAKHCVKGQKRTDVRVNRYEKNRLVETSVFQADVLGESYKSDLALLRLKDKGTIFPVATVAKEPSLRFGEDVFVAGYPMGGSLTYTTGTLGFVEEVSAFSQYSTSQEFYKATPDVVGGSSGSAMYHLTKEGNFEIIGTLTGGYRGISYISFFTPIEEINEYLDVAKKVYEVNVENSTNKS